MNTALTFLQRNWQRLGLDPYGAPAELSCIMATPRFRTSAHVIFLILARESPDPVLVVKICRLAGEAVSLHREAQNLQAVQMARPGGFDSIPRLVAYECFAATRLLVETGLPGRVMAPSLVREQPEECTEVLVRWITDFHLATANPHADAPAAYAHLLAEPLTKLDTFSARSSETVSLIDRTRTLTRSLAERRYPLVFEHGDMSAPNILLSNNNHLRVVDWELAEPNGLPGNDLFFALAYVAFARRQTNRAEDFITAFREAFFGRSAWARSSVMQYALAAGLREELLTPLFIACWSRYVAKLVERVGWQGGANMSKHSTEEWLKCNRYFLMWRHAVEYADELFP